jgi:hypothetical protein
MKFLFVVAVAALIAAPAYGQITCCYGWEDGGTILGYYGDNLVGPTNVSGPQSGLCGGCPGGTYNCPGAYEGNSYLHVAEEPHTGTPQAFVAWITGLVPGDVVTASFYGYDITPGASPSLRIWGHYADDVDITSYYGSASGLYDYTAGTGWDYVEYTWTFAATDPLATAIIVEARLYSTPSTSEDHTDFWIDYCCVTAPTTACIRFPQGPSPVEDSSWGTIKELFR